MHGIHNSKVRENHHDERQQNQEPRNALVALFTNEVQDNGPKEGKNNLNKGSHNRHATKKTN